MLRRQNVVGLLVDFPLRVIAIVGPLQRHFTGAHEAGEIVDMAVGFVEFAAPWQPDDLLGAEVIGQSPGHFFLTQMLVAIAIEQALLGGENAALAVALDTAQFGNRRHAVTVEPFDTEDFAGDLVPVTLPPGNTDPAVEAAVSVELKTGTPRTSPLSSLTTKHGPLSRNQVSLQVISTTRT